jgi:hypothetical protein
MISHVEMFKSRHFTMICLPTSTEFERWVIIHRPALGIKSVAALSSTQFEEALACLNEFGALGGMNCRGEVELSDGANALSLTQDDMEELHDIMLRGMTFKDAESVQHI